MKRILVLLAVGVVAAAVLWAQTSIKTAGNVETDAQLKSNVATGTPPLVVKSTTTVRNLSADLVDGYEGTALNTRLTNAETLLLMVQDQVHHSLLCRGGALRYLDLGDGTVWDCKQNLQWLKDADCLGTATWAIANGSVLDDFNDGTTGGACVGYAAGSYKDWRLATKSEWEAAVADGNSLDPQCESPALTSNGGARQVDDLPANGNTGAWVGTCASTGPFAFSGVESSFYWSSSTDAVLTVLAWSVNMNDGDVGNDSKTGPRDVWPVRGGQ